MTLVPISGKWCLFCRQPYPDSYEGGCVHHVQADDGPVEVCPGPIVQFLARREVVRIGSRPDKRSQQGRVLAAMERHPRGITQVDFDLPDVCDGGGPIKRVAARIDELINAGWPVEKAGTRDGCRIYRLRVEDRAAA